MNVFGGLISRLDMDDERISELEDISIEISKTEKQRKQKKNQNKKQKTKETIQGCGTVTKGVIYM